MLEANTLRYSTITKRILFVSKGLRYVFARTLVFEVLDFFR